MTGPGDVDPEVLSRIQAICSALPEAYEQDAWIGVRWRIRSRTFAHVFAFDLPRHPHYADVVQPGDAPSLMQFRVPLADLQGLVAGGYPFFKADWGHDVAVMVLDDAVDWAEVAELLTESYRMLAPKKLSAAIGLMRRDK
jgi:hypothetical protein